MENNIKILDELNKGCCMGIDALTFLIEKVDEHKFFDLLEKQKKEYEDFSLRINDLYNEYSDSEIHKTSTMEKMMTWYGIQKDTVLDKGTSNIADILIRGTTMGIIEGRKILNNKLMDKKVHKICSEYIDMQEEYIEKLKEFL